MVKIWASIGWITTVLKSNLRWIENLNMKGETKHLEENIGKYSYDLIGSKLSLTEYKKC